MGTPLRPPPNSSVTEDLHSRALTAAEGEELRAEIVDAINDQLIRAGIAENEGSAHEARVIRESMAGIRWVVAKFERHVGESG